MLCMPIPTSYKRMGTPGVSAGRLRCCACPFLCMSPIPRVIPIRQDSTSPATAGVPTYDSEASSEKHKKMIDEEGPSNPQLHISSSIVICQDSMPLAAVDISVPTTHCSMCATRPSRDLAFNHANLS